ncbi:MAG TPA: hypothetical protein VIV11_34285 [Kofleriaceae bacterium]
MIPRGAILGLGVLVVGCGEPAARVQLVPVNPCGGTAATQTALRVIGYTAGGELRRSVPPNEIDAFPADTEQLGVEVVGAGGGLVAIGKTAPLAFNALADQAEIPIVMAPPDGFCPVGPMMEPRTSPLVARAGDGVLIAGGLGPSGERLSTAEYYDPATTTFTAVSVPPSLLDADNGLAGAVLSELPDGRVVLTGTASHAFAIFSATDRRFTTPSLFDHRAFHGAYAVDAEHLLIIGGCADVAGGACMGPTLHTGFVYDLLDLAERERAPQLADTAQRYGARVFDLGIQRDGVRRFVLAGGFGEPGAADRFALADVATEPLANFHAQVTLLDGGALLTAFDPDAAAQTGAAAVLVPDGGLATIALAPRTAGARLATLEDGSVIAIGGDTNVAHYVPTTNAWLVVPPAGTERPSLFAPTLARLGDGSVLVLGGRDTTAEAWIYRPSLVGPASGSVVALPDGSTEGVLTPSDPTLLDRTGSRFVLESDADEYRGRALLGGPRISEGSVTVAATAEAGGIALIAQQTGPGHALVGRLVPGEPARIEQLAGGTTETLCSGQAVTAADLAGAVTLTISDGTATLGVGTVGSVIARVSCAVPTIERGAWGVAAAGANARIDIGAVTVGRGR